MLASKTNPETLFLPLDEQLGKINERQLLQSFQHQQQSEDEVEEYRTELVLLMLKTTHKIFTLIDQI